MDRYKNQIAETLFGASAAGWSPGSDDGRPEREKMKNIKVEWCENFIKSVFKKYVPDDGGIYTECFWDMAEKSGLWERGTYGSPMSKALEELTKVEIISDENGKYMYPVFRLA